MPTAYCYYTDHLDEPGRRYCRFDTNGHAVGSTLEEAVLHGLQELVERDSVTLWWYNRVRRPGVDLVSFGEPYLEAVTRHYREHGRDIWVLDLTSDLGIPVFAAVSRRTDQAEEQIVLGFGAHLDPRVGVLRAVTELNQLLPGFSSLALSRPRGTGVRRIVEDAMRHWMRTATASNQPYLAPDDGAPQRWRADYGRLWTEDVRDDVLRCQRILEAQRLEVLVLDQTRPEVGLPAVQVIVPGLRHFRPPRLAPGRLYDAPVRAGWLAQPLAEDQLNPIALFL